MKHEITVSDLARELGISTATVSKKRLAGRTDDQIRAEAAQYKLQQAAKDKLKEEFGGTARESYYAAQARKERAQASLKELELATKQGELVPLADVDQFISTAIIKARDILLRIGPENRDRLAVESDPIKIQELLDLEIHRALRVLADLKK